MGVYLVDIYCKGLLHSEYFFNLDYDDYEMMVRRIDMDEDLEKAEYADAHKLVYGAVDFAEAVGIDSEDSFDITKYILDEKEKSGQGLPPCSLSQPVSWCGTHGSPPRTSLL